MTDLETRVACDMAMACGGIRMGEGMKVDGTRGGVMGKARCDTLMAPSTQAALSTAFVTAKAAYPRLEAFLIPVNGATG